MLKTQMNIPFPGMDTKDSIRSLLEVDEVYHRPLSCLGAVQDFALEHHSGRSTAVQRYTEDAAFFTQQSGTLAVG